MRQNIQSLTVKPEELSGHLDEVARQGAQKMLRMALELEVETYVDQLNGGRSFISKEWVQFKYLWDYENDNEDRNEETNYKNFSYSFGPHIAGKVGYIF